MDCTALVEICDGLFSKRTSLVLLFQDIAENFYIERADFTYQRTIGTQYGGQLMSSYPLFCRRDLGDQIGQMLRPTAKEWFHSKPDDPARETNDAMQWLQYADRVQRRLRPAVLRFGRASQSVTLDSVQYRRVVSAA